MVKCSSVNKMRFHPGSRGQFKLPRLGYNREIRMWSLDHEIKIQSFEHVTKIRSFEKRFQLCNTDFRIRSWDPGHDPILIAIQSWDPDRDPILRPWLQSFFEIPIAIRSWLWSIPEISILIWSWDPDSDPILSWQSYPEIPMLNQSWDPYGGPILRSWWWSKTEKLKDCIL